jgi:hypothetical protein
MVPLFSLLSYIYAYVCKGIIEGPWQLVDRFPSIRAEYTARTVPQVMYTHKGTNQTFTSQLKHKTLGLDVQKQTSWRFK